MPVVTVLRGISFRVMAENWKQRGGRAEVQGKKSGGQGIQRNNSHM